MSDRFFHSWYIIIIIIDHYIIVICLLPSQSNKEDLKRLLDERQLKAWAVF